MFAMILAAPQSASAADVDLLELTGGDTRTLASATGSVAFPIRLSEAASPSTMEVEVTGVTRGTTSQAETDIAASMTASTLTLTITTPAAFMSQGDYVVSLLVTSGAADTENIQVTLTREAAVLTAGATVEVVQYVGWFFGLPIQTLSPTIAPDLSLSVGDGGDLVSLSAVQAERSAGSVTLLVPESGEDQSLATGAPHPLPTPVTAGGALNLDYALSDFPLGTSTRKVDVNSPQLTTPITVTFEVATRLSPVWIPIIVLVGLFAGWLARIALPWLTEWSRRRALRLRLVDIAQRMRNRYADSILHQTLSGIQATLGNTALTREELDEQQVALAGALQAAVSRLAAGRATASASEGLLVGGWRLPPVVNGALADARTAVNTEMIGIEARETDLMANRSATTNARLADLLAAAIEWNRVYLESLKALHAGLPSDPAVIDRLRLGQLVARLDDAIALSPASAADVRSALMAVNERTSQWNHSLRPAMLRVSANLAPDEAAASLEQKLSHLDPATAVSDSRAEFVGLIAAAVAGVAGVNPGPVVASTPSPAGVDTSILLTISGSDGDSLHTTAGRGFFTGVGALAEVVRYLLLAVIASGVALAVGQASWVGTPDQVLIVFGWAFALDLSTEVVKTMFAADASLPTFATPATPATPATGQ